MKVKAYCADCGFNVLVEDGRCTSCGEKLSKSRKVARAEEDDFQFAQENDEDELLTGFSSPDDDNEEEEERS